MKHFEPYARTAVRVVAGFLFACHGLQKLAGMFGGMPGGGTAKFASEIWIAGVLELVGGVLVGLGLFARPAAFILSGQMAVAYFQVHGSRGFYPIRNGGELAVLYCFLFLYLFAAGPGPISLDRLLRRIKT